MISSTTQFIPFLLSIQIPHYDCIYYNAIDFVIFGMKTKINLSCKFVKRQKSNIFDM